MKLFTVGYQGFDIEDFAHFLAKKRVRRVIYVHLPGWGTPSAWRKMEQKHRMRPDPAPDKETLFKRC